VRGITAPTLIIQGTVDVLFPLQQAIVNAGFLAQNENVKMIWYCGGHGTCLPGQGNPDADDVWVMGETLAWMERYIKDDGTTDDNTFEWTDQNGDRWTSEVLPTGNGFYDDPGSVPTTVWNTGKVLPIIPFIGGSGPNPEVPLPYSLGDGSIASNAVTIALQNPAAEANVVGAPQVLIHYSGLGTSRHVYAQVVDRSTGLVVGNLVSPVPVTLNGRDQTATVDLNDIAYTVGPDSELELQIFTTATPYLNLTQFGFINVHSVEVTLPTTTQGTNQGPNPTPATVAEQLVAV
jgi:ABC-2 type transport system ATP-binding protein